MPSALGPDGSPPIAVGPGAEGAPPAPRRKAIGLDERDEGIYFLPRLPFVPAVIFWSPSICPAIVSGGVANGMVEMSS